MGNINITPIVFRIVVLNVIVFLALNLGFLGYFGFDTDTIFGNFFVLHKSDLLLPRNTAYYGAFLPVQLITAFFSHSGFFHIFFNMWALINFGAMMEMVMGQKRFFAFYMFCGIVGAIFTAFIDPSDIPVVGASGAIMGVMTGFGLFFPDQKMTFLMPFPITMSAKNWMLTLGGISALFVVLGAFNIAPSITGGISHFGHLAGMIAALIFFYSGIGKYIS